ncbi:MAG TPA: glycerol-3-phosphate acyltransferase [Steroidobacteraceae bacterium]|nr:glycerol-3-phosphate acyltransferase [Steroidobacteraceae bacterium]
MLELGLKTLIGYLLGSVVGALLVGQFRGIDIRTMGSGNAGGTNALRTQGLVFAAATVVIDAGKGWLAAGWLPGLALPGVATDPAIARGWLAASCAASAVAGHVWPLWHDFRGGKGGATLAGALLALAPALLAVAVATWLAFALLFGFVALATVAAAAAVPVAASVAPVSGAMPAFGLAMAALVAWAHRGNFARMRAGTEPRANRIWLFRSRGAPR